MLPHLLVLTLTLASSLVSAALYPKDSLVKMVDTKGFRNALKENRTSVVAFVASWCGYCKAMVPEYSKTARGLHPLIPLYAVDCDENRSLCAEQGVKGFPTIKLFPRGKEHAPIPFEHPERTASAFFYFATRRVPHKNKKLNVVEDIEPWVNDKIDQTRVLLLSKAKDIPLMWKVLANKYRDDFAFANHRDHDGTSSVTLGYDAGTQKDSKILVYPIGSAQSVLFEGVPKYKSISTFFDSILDGTANLTAPNSHQPEEEEIARKGQDTDFHGEHDYTAPSSDTSKVDESWENAAGEEDTNEREENPIYRAIRIQLEMEGKNAKDAPGDSIPESGDIDQDVLELRTTGESTHLSTTSDSKVAAQGSETCISESVSDRVVSSCTSPEAEGALPTHRGESTPEAGHVKDEL